MAAFYLRELPKYDDLAAVADRAPFLTVPMMQGWLGMLKASNDLLAAHEAMIAEYGLSVGRFTALMILYHHAETQFTPSELADRMGVTRATMTGLLDGLESAGLVRREVHPEDRRAVRIHLTPPGREKLERLLPLHFERVARFMEVFTPAELLQLNNLLGKVRQHLATICPEPEPRPTPLH